MYVCDEPQLQVTLSSDEHGMPVVSVFGEIDLHSVDLFDTLLTRGVFEARRNSGRLLVDLRGVEFLDTAGLGVLMRARDRLRSAAGELVMVCDGQIRPLLEITGLSKELELFPDLRTASEGHLSPA